MIETWTDYDPWQRLWPGIDKKWAIAVVELWRICKKGEQRNGN